MFTFTLCFICRGERILMVNRRKAPNMGLWNGVGGKLEAGEPPRLGVMREVAEETGLLLPEVTFAGTLTWTEADGPRQGIYIFLADLPPGGELATPKATPEGILEWLDVGWVTHPDNCGVVSNIKYCLPPMLRGEPPLNYHFAYRPEWSFAHQVEPLTKGGAGSL